MEPFEEQLPVREDHSRPAMRLLSVILPVHNEEMNLRELCARLAAALEPTGVRYEVVIVDDASADRSFAVARQISEQDPRVRVMRLSRQFGHQTALCAGIDQARGDAIVTMDADLQHPPELIPELIRKYQEGYEIVYTVRAETEKQGYLKRVTSKLFYQLFRRVANVDLQAGTADFRLVGEKAIAALKRFRERHLFLRGIISWMGFRQAAVTYRASLRAGGRSKYNFRRMLGFAFDALFSFSYFPMRLVVVLGLLFDVLAVVYAVYILDYRLTHTDALPGWSSVMLVILFVSGLLLLTLGVLGEYLARVYEEVKGRPLYIVEDAIGFEETGERRGNVKAAFGK